MLNPPSAFVYFGGLGLGLLFCSWSWSCEIGLGLGIKNFGLVSSLGMADEGRVRLWTRRIMHDSKLE